MTDNPSSFEGELRRIVEGAQREAGEQDRQARQQRRAEEQRPADPRHQRQRSELERARREEEDRRRKELERRARDAASLISAFCAVARRHFLPDVEIGAWWRRKAWIVVPEYQTEEVPGFSADPFDGGWSRDVPAHTLTTDLCLTAPGDVVLVVSGGEQNTADRLNGGTTTLVSVVPDLQGRLERAARRLATPAHARSPIRATWAT